MDYAFHTESLVKKEQKLSIKISTPQWNGYGDLSELLMAKTVILVKIKVVKLDFRVSKNDFDQFDLDHFDIIAPALQENF